jgi:ribosomal protein S18 acetylase RimI-like enzyme
MSKNSMDIKKAAEFISKQNSDLHTQISWLSEKEEIIARELTNLPISFNHSFIVEVQGDRLKGLLGFYYQSEQRAVRLLGPYLETNSWQKDADSLFEKLLPLLPSDVETIKIACPEQNKNCLDFCLRNRFEQYNAETNMSLTQSSYIAPQLTSSNSVRISRITEAQYAGFEKLHPQGVYFTAKEVLSNLNDHNVIFTALINEKVVGYIYTEAEGDKAEINFIQVDNLLRGKGIGSSLLTYVIDYHFKKNIKVIDLSVRPENRARTLYEKFGFNSEKTIIAMKRSKLI